MKKYLLFALLAIWAVSSFFVYSVGSSAYTGEDVCENIDDVQYTVPPGYVRNGDNECYEQVVCDTGKQCGWVNVTNVRSFGVPAAGGPQNFYNDQTTKDRLCRLSAYEYNKSDTWATRFNRWDNCNDEFYVTWTGSDWYSRKCNAVSYVSEVYCAKDMPVPPSNPSTPPPPPPPPPTPPAPTVSISVNPLAVSLLSRTTISWSSDNADSCVASGSWNGEKATSGSEVSSVFMNGDKTFYIACSGPGGSASGSATANMYIVPSSPTITWTVFPGGNVPHNATYRVDAYAEDEDGNLVSVTIDKDGTAFAYAGGGDGYSNSTGGDTSDAGPKTVLFSARAADSTGRVTQITRQAFITGPSVITAPSAPTIRWRVFPESAVPSDTEYRVEAVGYDTDNDLVAVSIDKDARAFAYAGGGDGYANMSGNTTKDVGPKTVMFAAWATDAGGRRSATISRNVTISAPPSQSAPITASVSAPSCSAPGKSFTVTGNAQGSNIYSNILEKDTNLDGVFGAVASRGDAGETRATVSVPSNETSSAYNFRVNVNNGQYSAVARVSISANCDTPICFFGLCSGSNTVNNPPGPVAPVTPPSVTPPSTPPPSAPSSPNPGSGGGGGLTCTATKSFDNPLSLSVSGTNATISWSLPGGFCGAANPNWMGSQSNSPSGSVSTSISRTTTWSASCVSSSWPPAFYSPSVTATCSSAPTTCQDPSASNYNGALPCQFAGFTISAQPTNAKARTLAGYAGLSDEIKVSVNPVSGFTAPVRIDIASSPDAIRPEFSFDGGTTWSTSPSAVMTLSGSNYAYNGLIYIPVRIRFSGRLDQNGIYDVVFRGTPQPGGRGSDRPPSTSAVRINSSPLYPGFTEI